MQLAGDHWDKTGKKEIVGALGFLVLVFFSFFIFIMLLYFLFPDVNPVLAFGLHLCFLIILYLLLTLWGSWGRVRGILQKWFSRSRARGALYIFELLIVKPRIKSLLSHQFSMVSLFSNSPIIDDNYVICFSDSGKPMCND